MQNLHEYHFPFTDQGFKDGCDHLKKTLEETQGSNKIVNITIVFDSVEQPNNVYSVKYVKNISSCLTLTGLEKDQKTDIFNVFQSFNINPNSVIERDITSKTPQGGEITHGSQVEFTGIRANIDSLRKLFPGKTDEELQKLFG